MYGDVVPVDQQIKYKFYTEKYGDVVIVKDKYYKGADPVSCTYTLVETYYELS